MSSGILQRGFDEVIVREAILRYLGFNSGFSFEGSKEDKMDIEERVEDKNAEF